MSDAQGHPLVLAGGVSGSDTKGLWGLSFGNGKGSGSTSTLYFNTGFNDEQDGLFGSLTASSAATASAHSIVAIPAHSAGAASAPSGRTSAAAEAIDIAILSLLEHRDRLHHRSA